MMNIIQLIWTIICLFLITGLTIILLLGFLSHWKAFFNAMTAYRQDKSKFNGRPAPPQYKPKHGQFMLIFTNQQATLTQHTLRFPKSLHLPPINTRLDETTNLREVRIIPKGTGYVCEIVYEKEICIPSTPPPQPTNIASIDLGVRNLVTMVNNIGLSPIAVKGGIVKSINQYYNKKRAKLQSIYDTRNHGIKHGTAMSRLTNRRNRRIHDHFHKISRYIINYCHTNAIDTLVIGYNNRWKQHCRIGKRNTQNFVSIPFYKLVQQLEYKAEEYGITIIKQDEKYTSKCSFLDNEPIEPRQKYMGRRIGRGLFQSSHGTIINADVNGAYNILAQAIPKAFENVDGIADKCSIRMATHYHPIIHSPNPVSDVYPLNRSHSRITSDNMKDF